jgi:Helix-turn-helix domain
MKGSIGTSTSIYHTRLPHQRKLQRMTKTVSLSREAEVRISWLGRHKKHQNVKVTCRRFAISRSTLYKCVNRHIERGPLGLEDLSRAPKTYRTSTVPWQTVELIVAIRKEQPA